MQRKAVLRNDGNVVLFSDEDACDFRFFEPIWPEVNWEEMPGRIESNSIPTKAAFEIKLIDMEKEGLKNGR